MRVEQQAAFGPHLHDYRTRPLGTQLLRSLDHFCVTGRCTTGEGCQFGLVGGKNIGDLQKLERQRNRGGWIEENPGTAGARLFGCQHHRFQRNFQLQKHEPTSGEQSRIALQFARRKLPVRPLDDQDPVARISSNQHERLTGKVTERTDSRDGTSLGSQGLTGKRAVLILADAAHHGDIAAKPAGREGLVRALAAMAETEMLPKDRFPNPRKSIVVHDDVAIDAADDCDGETSAHAADDSVRLLTR